MLRRKVFCVVFLFFVCTIMLNITGCTQVGHVKSLEDYRTIRFKSTEEIDESKKEEVSEDENKENYPTASPENNTKDNKTKNNQETKEETETINFEDIKVNPDVSYGYYYDQLSDELKKIYILLMSKMDIISKEYIKITNIDFDIESFEIVANSIRLDDFYYYIYNFSYYSEEKSIRVNLQNNISASQKRTAEKQAYEIVRSINSNSEIELVQKIYDWCTKNIVYDEALNKKHNRDLYGALIKKESVCVGYARAFSYMCGLAGIKCINVMNGKQNHLYNYVQIDSKWYGVDTTNGKTGTNLFLLEGKEFLEMEQHIPFEGFDLPELSEESIFED